MTQQLIDKLVSRARMDGITSFVTGGAISLDNSILIVKRNSDDFLPGIYELPGGDLMPGESITEGLSREVLEETNLEIKIGEYIGHFDYSSETGRTKRQFNFLLTPTSSRSVKLSSEHQDYTWITKDQIDNYEITDSVKNIIKDSFKMLENFLASNSV
jgi:8-oxo-dGTP diphosphatase